MKKIFYAFAVVILGLTSACKNDDIEITKVGKLHSLTANINTQSVYEEFDMTTDIREIMRDQDYAIGVFNFLYDSKGNLVAEKASQQFNFNNISEDFSNLLEGSYTLVTVETLVDPDQNNQPNDWSFDGKDKLSTLQINQDSYEVYFPFVIGVSTSNIVIGDGNQSVAVTPKGIGSMVQFYFLNFDKSTHVEVGFATNDIIASYRLDPSLSRSDRFNTNLTQSGYINLRCERDIDADRVSATRYILESSIQYRFCFVKAENEGTGIWTNYASNEGTVALEDGKTYYGGFYYVNSSTTPKSYFGDNTGFRTWYSEVTTTNTDNSLVPSALSMNWGGSVSNIQSAMNGYNMTTGTSGRAVAQNDGSYMIEYAGKNKETKILYYFTSATTGLFESDVQYSKSAVSSTDILAYLNANYTYLAESEGTYMYVTTDAKTYVLFFTVNDNWNIGFVDVNYVNSSSVKALIPRHVLANRAPRIAPQDNEGERTSKGRSLNVGIPYKEVRNAK